MTGEQLTEVEKELIKFYKDDGLFHGYSSRASNMRRKFCKAGLMRQETTFATFRGRTRAGQNFTSCWMTDRGHAVLNTVRSCVKFDSNGFSGGISADKMPSFAMAVERDGLLVE